MFCGAYKCRPAFATYAKLMDRSLANWCSTRKFHCSLYGSRYWSGNTVVTPWRFAAVGSMTGGRRKFCGNPPSQLKAGVVPESAEENDAVVEKPNAGSPRPWLM